MRFFFLLMVLCLAGAALGNAYNLRIDFDGKSLRELIDAKQGVILARVAPVGGWNTIWTTFRPFEFNYVDWDDESYGIYAAIGSTSNGRVVSPGSWTRGSLGLLYPFNAAGIFGSGRSVNWVARKEIGLMNNGTGEYIFGLTANVTVNSRIQTKTPIFAEELLSFEHKVWTPSDDVYLFLGPEETLPGLLTDDLYQVANSQITTLTFDANTPKRHVAWDSDSGRFITVA